MVKFFLHRCSFREECKTGSIRSAKRRQEGKLYFWTAGLKEQNLHLFLNYSLKFPLSFWGSCISPLQHTLWALSPPLSHKQHAIFVDLPPTRESGAGLRGSDRLSVEDLSEERLCKAAWGENKYSKLTPSVLLGALHLKIYRIWLFPTKYYSQYGIRSITVERFNCVF